MNTPYYIYRHIRPDKDQVFYVGKGKNRRNTYTYERAYATEGHNTFWQRIVAKCRGKYVVEIVMEFKYPDACVAKEKELISLYGRADCGKGTLCNLTDRGDGGYGRIYSAKQRQARSERVKGVKHPNWGKRLSLATCARKSLSISGKNHFLYGKNLPEGWRDNIAKAKIGSNNPMSGRTGRLHHLSKTILDTSTGEIYYGIAAAAKAVGVTPSSLYQYLDGSRPNRTTLIIKRQELPCSLKS